ncbi:MAG: hypothetical protein EOO13_11620 [Chitinophagaceae bacterium]|nr:MAG: hypothetical protein EOO13_11620 [Chitinophagaceae bacterium]
MPRKFSPHTCRCHRVHTGTGEGIGR